MTSRIKQGARLRLIVLLCAFELVISASSQSGATSAASWEHPPCPGTRASTGLLGGGN